MATLSFMERFTPRVEGDRWSFDVMIDEQTLLDYLGVSDSELLGCFGWRTNRKYELKLLNELKEGKFSSSDNGLFPLYVCAECGDMACGALVCEIEINDRQVIWKNLAHSDGQLPILSDQYIKKPEIQFEKKQYNEALQELASQIAYWQ